MNDERVLLQLENICKYYNYGKPNELCVLNNVQFTVQKGEFISIVGRSGSGKSTLMNIIGMLDLPTFGKYQFEDTSVFEASEKKMTQIRRKKIGFIFQNFELIPDLDVQKNVELPMLYAGIGRKERTKRAMALLERVSLSDHLHYMPNELSGGQKQRAAIARALVNHPQLLLADEPTGALDYENGRSVMQLLHELHETGITILLITHDRELAAGAKRCMTIADGKLVCAEINEKCS